ncbi:MAG: UTP--glucose-1-phosphate uridylyltransferase GalU [Marinobacterium sp.]|nr:UTP--glucose-1-phosphate uridylyltransferase GalU [Marinobacterium sp.]
MTVTTAIIPVAGLGTRVLPASKSIPKEMLPVVDKPAIQYVVEEAVAAGITQIVLVTRSGKEAIENHFDRNFELEHILASKKKTALLDSIRNVVPEHVSITSVRQNSPAGLGHAVHCAASITGDRPFAVLLPDVLVQNQGGQNDLRQMIALYEKQQYAQIMVEAVPQDRVGSYGIVDCRGEIPASGQSVPLMAMVEKPAPDEAPSNLAITGRYILPGRVMTLLEDIQPGAGGEIQLTDAIQALTLESTVEAYQMQGASHDCGNKAGYLLANVSYGLVHPETAAELRDFLSSYGIDHHARSD